MCEGPYLLEGFLDNLCPRFIIVFAPLGVITRTNNKVVKIVAASVLINYKPFQKISNEKSSCSEYLPVKLADGKRSTKKEKISPYLIYNIISFSKMDRKTDFFFSGKISCIQTCSEISIAKI